MRRKGAKGREAGKGGRERGKEGRREGAKEGRRAGKEWGGGAYPEHSTCLQPAETVA